MPDTVAAQVHDTNKAVLESVQDAVSPPNSPPSAAPAAAPNPLLSRGKLKKSGKSSKSSSKFKGSKGSTTPDFINAVEQAKKDELAVVSSAGASDDANAESADVLDLADQLLAQLDARDPADETSAGPIPIANHDSGLKPPQASSAQLKKSSSSSSVGSGNSRFHDMKEGIKHAFSPHSHSHPSSPNDTGTPQPDGKMSRQKARKLRKEQETEAIRTQAERETAAQNDHSVQEERDAIQKGCQKLGVRIREIDPDGHCLFSAVADQVNSLKLSSRKEDYTSTRAAAASYMREHPDDFLPFFVSEINDDAMMSPQEYESYCATVEKTAEWGGEPEIRALSKYFNAPIHVLQAGTDLIKTGGEDEASRGRGPMLISYHRKMYGLGEHYNSLRPAHYGGINQPDFQVEAYSVV